MDGFDRSSLISKVVTEVKRRVAGLSRNPVISLAIRRVPVTLRKQLFYTDENIDLFISDFLATGDELCRGRMIPMSLQLITKIKFIYRFCKSYLSQKSKLTPVIYASRLGYADMVWGFIQCSIETETNLHTQEPGRPEEFLWLRDQNGRTALDHAIFRNHVEVVKILMSEVSNQDLVSAWNSIGKILLPVLHDYPEHDGFIFDMLEEDKSRVESGQPPILNIDPENVEYTTRIQMETEKRRKYIDKLCNPDLLKCINPNTNIIFHIVSKAGDVGYVNLILQNSPSLISGHNSEGETPVYLAAKEGHLDVLQIMFNHLKEKDEDIESLLIRRKDEHNALHIAIQNHHAPVVFLLLEEVPQLANHENAFKESPLYLAAELRYAEIVKLILKKCKDWDKSFTGPNGKTALHAAAISNSGECVYNLLQEWPGLVNKKDENDWSPWRYAIQYNSSLAVESLLYADQSLGYQLVTQDDTFTSALHIAASRGHCETMKVLMRICLGSREFDSKGRNILHVAIESNQTEVIEFIFQDKSLKSLINQKDNNGNTPVHLLAKSNFEMMQKVIDFGGNVHSLNIKNRTPLDMIDSDEKRERLIKAIATGTNMSNNRSSSSIERIRHDLLEKEFEGKQKKTEARFKMVDNMVLVVTLIATATFAAAFTVPGGFDSDNGSKQGTPYLLRKAAFQAFVITNAIAFCCSCSVLLGHIVLLIYRNRYDEADDAEQNHIDDRIVIMYFLTGIALFAILIAFVTGFYVVLLPSLLLAIFICAFSICIVVASLSYWLYF